VPIDAPFEVREEGFEPGGFFEQRDVSVPITVEDPTGIGQEIELVVHDVHGLVEIHFVNAERAEGC
jgi:hypothetical protein